MITITKNASEATVVTHGGIFHSDDVLATVILEKIFGEIIVLRTRNFFKEDIPENAFVYDVGLGEYDHHQKGGNGHRENGIPFSSVGLIWRDFGHEFLKNTSNPDLIWHLIDRDLIQGVDAVDNGKMPRAESPVQVMSICQAISAFNPNWDDKAFSADEAFLEACQFAKSIFNNNLSQAESKARAKEIVEDAISKTEGEILILNQFVPWQETVFSSSKEKAREILIVIYPSDREGYNWQLVPVELGRFENKISVPNNWNGLYGPELQKETGLRTPIFCHPKGFIGGAKTLEDTISMAKLAIEASKKKRLK